MKRVLMIAYDFPPWLAVGASIRIAKFLKYMSKDKLGWEADVLTLDDSNMPDSYFDGARFLLREIPESVRIYKCRDWAITSRYYKRGEAGRDRGSFGILRLIRGILHFLVPRSIRILPDRAAYWLVSATYKGWRLLRKGEYDLIYVTAPPHSVTLVGAFLKMITGYPLVLDIKDDWIDNPLFNKRPRFFQVIERYLERFVVSVADKVILVTTRSRGAFKNRYPRQKDKFSYISNGCDIEEYTFLDGLSREERKEDFQLEIVHAGSLGLQRDPHHFFKAVRELCDEHQDMRGKLRIVFIGKLLPAFKRHIEHLGLSDIVLEREYMPREEFILTLWRANLLLVINYRGYNTLVPGKLYDYWATGNPILLLDTESIAKEILQENRLGICVNPEDIGNIKKAILYYYENWKNGEQIKIDTTNLKKYDRKELTKTLINLFNMVVEE